MAPWPERAYQPLVSGRSRRMRDVFSSVDWHSLNVPPDHELDLLRQVVRDIVGDDAAEVEWMSPGDGWSAHARLRGRPGLVSHLLTSAEWQEVRFEEPRCSAFILTSDEDDDVREALTKLARAAVEYLAGRGQLEQAKGILKTRSILVLRTSDGEWRVGRRSSGLLP